MQSNAWTTFLLLGLLGGCSSPDSSHDPDAEQSSPDAGQLDASEDAASAAPDVSRGDCATYDGRIDRCKAYPNCAWIGSGRVCAGDAACVEDAQSLDLCVDVGLDEALQVGGLYFRKSDGLVAMFPQVFAAGAVQGWGRCESDLVAGEPGAPPTCDCWMSNIEPGVCD